MFLSPHFIQAAKLLGLMLSFLAIFLSVEASLAVHIPDFEVRGRRAGNRIRALHASLLWPLVQPLVSFFAAYASHLQAPRIRARLELFLRQADDPRGLVPSEVLGLSLFAALALGLLSGTHFSWAMALPAALLGLYLPYDQVRNAAQRRILSVGRSIPTMADLIVLAMESGLDFIGAVRLLVAKTAVADGKMPVRDELLMFLNQLQLGRTRRAALTTLAERIPTDSVRSFVSAVVQAEEKGMPLRDVLRIQAEVLRHKRVQEAEAYIEIANLRMMAPVMLVVASLLMVIVVPVVFTMDGSMQGGGLSP